MLPDIENLDDLILNFEKEENLKTQTFGINLQQNFMSGKIDDLDAIRQAIYLLLSIEADQYIIYPYTYGIRTIDLFGKPSYYVMAVIPERIKEALFRDDRITDVSDFEFEVNGNKLGVKFIVHTIYGNLEEEMVVQY